MLLLFAREPVISFIALMNRTRRTTTYLPSSDQLSTTDRLPSVHLSTTNLPSSDHLSATELPPSDHLSTTDLPPRDQLSTNSLPPGDHLPTTEHSPSDHLSATNLPPSDQPFTTSHPPSDHLSTTILPPSDHLSTTNQHPSDHLSPTNPPPSYHLSTISFMASSSTGGRPEEASRSPASPTKSPTIISTQKSLEKEHQALSKPPPMKHLATEASQVKQKRSVMMTSDEKPDVAASNYYIKQQANFFRTPNTGPQQGLDDRPAAATTEELVLTDNENPPPTTNPRYSKMRTLSLQSTTTKPPATESSISTTVTAVLESSTGDASYLVAGKPGAKNPSVVGPPDQAACVNVACIDHNKMKAIHCLDLSWENGADKKYRPLKSKKLVLPLTLLLIN